MSRNPDFFENLVYSSSESIILKEIITMISQGGAFSINGILTHIGKIMSKTLMMLVSQYLIKNPSKLFSVFKNLFIKFFYTKKVLKPTLGSLDNIVSNVIKKTLGDGDLDGKTKSCQYGFFPIVMTIGPSEEIYEYFSPTHGEFIEKCIADATERYNDRKMSKKTVCKAGASTYIPLELFPSTNYINLTKKVKAFFEVSALMGNRATKAIVINGVPGLGKTNSIDFIARQNLVDEVIRMDMTKYMSSSFKGVCDSITSSGSVVICFDEIDKWLEYTISHRYTDLAAKKEIELEYDIYYRQEKEKFLYEVLELLQTTKFPLGAMIIFCSNNFDTIFEGIDMTHFHSFIDRLLNVKFELCDTDEFKRYITYVNEKLKGSDYEIPDLDEHLIRIRPDIQITFRRISDISTDSCYHIPTIIDKVNEYMILKEKQPIDSPVYNENSDKKSINRLMKISVSPTPALPKSPETLTPSTTVPSTPVPSSPEPKFIQPENGGNYGDEEDEDDDDAWLGELKGESPYMCDWTQTCGCTYCLLWREVEKANEDLELEPYDIAKILPEIKDGSPETPIPGVNESMLRADIRHCVEPDCITCVAMQNVSWYLDKIKRCNKMHIKVKIAIQMFSVMTDHNYGGLYRSENFMKNLLDKMRDIKIDMIRRAYVNDGLVPLVSKLLEVIRTLKAHLDMNFQQE